MWLMQKMTTKEEISNRAFNLKSQKPKFNSWHTKDSEGVETFTLSLEPVYHNVIQIIAHSKIFRQNVFSQNLL